jgi:hypothetical protein
MTNRRLIDRMGRNFTEPLGSRLPALEQNVLKFRALSMILVLFYAENLKQTAIDLIKTSGGRTGSRLPDGAKNIVDKALTALVADAAITALQKNEIVKLIDYRNFIGHQIHNLLADVGGPFAHKQARYLPANAPKYDDTAVKRLRFYRKHFDGLYRTHHYEFTLSPDRFAFEAAEKTYLREIRRLKRKIDRQYAFRCQQVDGVNAELSLKGTGLEEEVYHPLNRYDNSEGQEGRLTKRGIAVLYKLFDLGKSSMAVAHLTRLSLTAVKKRRKMWSAMRDSSCLTPECVMLQPTVTRARFECEK